MSVHRSDGSSASRQAEQAGHATQGRHGHQPTHDRGQFSGYTFRLGRAPLQNAARRQQALRSRPTAQQRAQVPGEEMQSDYDPMQRAGGSDLDDDQRRRPPPAQEAGQQGAKQQGDRPPAPPPLLKARLPPATPPALPLSTRLLQAGWPGADVLWSKAPQRPSVRQLVQALVSGLLAAALPAQARPAAAGSGTLLRMALMAAFHRSGASAPELSTLAQVKELAMSHRAAQPPRPRDVSLSEAERSANALAIPLLMITLRQRLQVERLQAADRLELLSRSPSLQGTKK